MPSELKKCINAIIIHLPFNRMPCAKLRNGNEFDFPCRLSQGRDNIVKADFSIRNQCVRVVGTSIGLKKAL